MRVEWLVARRYLRSPYRPPVLRLVTVLSVLGVAAGVATLVVALAMNTGFRQTMQERLLGVTAHLTLTSPQGRLTPYGLIPRTRRFRVAGIFDSGFYDYDADWCFVTLSAAQGLSGAPELVSVLEFRIAHVDQAGDVANRLAREAGDGFAATTWMEANKALFRAS